MSPTLNDGDFVITPHKWLAYFCPKLQLGSLVVVQHPHYKTMIKRVIELNSEGKFRLAGENNASVESQQIGWLSKTELLGIVLFYIRK